MHLCLTVYVVMLLSNERQVGLYFPKEFTLKKSVNLVYK